MKDYQKEKFGYEGELFQKGKNWVKPDPGQKYMLPLKNWPRNAAMISSLTRPTAPLYSFADEKNDRNDDVLHVFSV